MIGLSEELLQLMVAVLEGLALVWSEQRRFRSAALLQFFLFRFPFHFIECAVRALQQLLDGRDPLLHTEPAVLPEGSHSPLPGQFLEHLGVLPLKDEGPYLVGDFQELEDA